MTFSLNQEVEIIADSGLFGKIEGRIQSFELDEKTFLVRLDKRPERELQEAITWNLEGYSDKLLVVPESLISITAKNIKKNKK